jgi:hypothetical protein
MFGCWSQHARHKLATCSPQTRNITRNTYTMSEEEGGGATWEKVFATWEKVFATLKRCSQHEKRCPQHLQHASQHHDPTADMFPNSNRVAEKVSDPSAQIGRPDASSSFFLIRTQFLPKADVRGSSPWFHDRHVHMLHGPGPQGNNSQIVCQRGRRATGGSPPSTAHAIFFPAGFAHTFLSFLGFST